MAFAAPSIGDTLRARVAPLLAATAAALIGLSSEDTRRRLRKSRWMRRRMTAEIAVAEDYPTVENRSWTDEGGTQSTRWCLCELNGEKPGLPAVLLLLVATSRHPVASTRETDWARWFGWDGGLGCRSGMHHSPPAVVRPW